MTEDHLPIDKQKEYSLIKKYSTMIMINKMNYIIIENENIIFRFIENVDAFFEKLINKIEENDFRELDDDFRWGILPF